MEVPDFASMITHLPAIIPARIWMNALVETMAETLSCERHMFTDAVNAKLHKYNPTPKVARAVCFVC